MGRQRCMAPTAPRITAETRRRIEAGLAQWDDPHSDARRRFDASKREWDARFQPLTEALEASERLTAHDLTFRINV